MSGSNATGLDSWIGGNGDWANGANWSAGTPPNGGDATIDPPNSVAVNVESTETEQVGNLAVQANSLGIAGTLQLSGTLDLTQGGELGLAPAGVLSGGTLAVNATSTFVAQGSATTGPLLDALSGVRVQGGLTVNYGTLAFRNGTTLFSDAPKAHRAC